MVPNVVISYVPLFVGQPGVVFAPEDINNLMKGIDESMLGTAKGAVWTVENGAATVTFVIDKAQEISDHLKAWSEGKPSEWFTCQITKNSGGYGMALLPELEKSAMRMKAAYGATDEEVKSVRIVFRPIAFSSVNSGAFDQAQPYIKDRIQVFLLDSELVNEHNLSQNHLNFRVELAEFKVVHDGLAKPYIEEMIASMKEDLKN